MAETVRSTVGERGGRRPWQWVRAPRSRSCPVWIVVGRFGLFVGIGGDRPRAFLTQLSVERPSSVRT